MVLWGSSSTKHLPKLSRDSSLEISSDEIELYVEKKKDKVVESSYFKPCISLNHLGMEGEDSFTYRMKVLQDESYGLSETNGEILPNDVESTRLSLKPRKMHELLLLHDHVGASSVFEDNFTVQVDFVPKKMLKEDSFRSKDSLSSDDSGEEDEIDPRVWEDPRRKSITKNVKVKYIFFRVL